MFLTADMSKREKDTGCYEKAIKFLSPNVKSKVFTDIDNAHSLMSLQYALTVLLTKYIMKTPIRKYC